METVVLAAAQSVPIKADPEKNLDAHLRLISVAVSNGAHLVHFPELSLCGYEPELCADLASTIHERTILPLSECAKNLTCTIVAGAPVKTNTGIRIGAYILTPDGSINLYTKHYLHPGEEIWFMPGTDDWLITLGGLQGSLAICADITHEEHFSEAHKSGSHIYLPGVFITPQGYAADSRLLSNHAAKYRMPVLMANFGGPSGKYDAAGKSAFWSPEGRLLASLPETGEGIVLGEFAQNRWRARSLVL